MGGPPPPVPNLLEHTLRVPMINPATRPYSDIMPTIAFPMPELPADPGYLPPRAPPGPSVYPPPTNIHSRPPHAHHSVSDPTSAMSPNTVRLFDQELENEQMRQALELSKREEALVREREMAADDEAKQLARALAESLRDSGARKAENDGDWEQYDPALFSSPTADAPGMALPGPSNSFATGPLPPASAPVVALEASPPASPSFSRPLPVNDDEMLARRMALEGFQKERGLRDSKIMPPMPNPGESSFPLPSYNDVVAAGPSRPPSGPLIASGSGYAPHLPRSTSVGVITATPAPPLLRPHSQSVGSGAIARNLPARPHTSYGPSASSSSPPMPPLPHSDSRSSLDVESVSEAHESDVSLSSAHLGKQLSDGTQTIEEDLARGTCAYDHSFPVRVSLT